MASPTSLSDHQRLVILQEFALQAYGRWSHSGETDSRDNSLSQFRVPTADTKLEALAQVAKFAAFLSENYPSSSFQTRTDQVISDLTKVIVGDSLYGRDGWYWSGETKGNSGFASESLDATKSFDDQGAHAVGGLFFGFESRFVITSFLMWGDERLNPYGREEDFQLYRASYNLGATLSDNNINALGQSIRDVFGDHNVCTASPFGFDSQSRNAEGYRLVNKIFNDPSLQ